MKTANPPLWTTLLIVVVMCTAVNAQETCGPFTFTPTAESGVFVGQATIGGVPADAADCIAAFDADGNCAGATSIVINGGLAYINLPIYGDDLLTGGVDEGMNAGENFTFALYDASADAVLPMNPDTAFGCWVNTNGTPLPGPCGDFNLVHDFGGGGGEPCDPPAICLDHVDGLNPDGTLPAGGSATFHLRVKGDADTHGGVANGFRVFSPDGACWGTTVGDTTGTLGKAQFDGGFFINPFSITGCDADTLGFAGFRFFSTGLTPFFDDIAYTIDIGPIDAGANGKNICLDSAFYPPSGVWKWAGPDVFPNWDGPHCFTILGDCEAPAITCPSVPFGVDACAGDEVCVPLEITGATSVTVEGATWSGGQLCFTPSASGPLNFHVVASNDCGEAICDVTVNVTLTDPPAITCPSVPFDVTACAGDQVCIPLDIAGADDVSVNGATWANGQLCFTAGASGPMSFTVVATNQCGQDECDVTVNVTITDPPAITCPSVPFDVTACAGDEVCVPLEITGATSVTVEGASWADGQLCFTADQSGPHNFTVIADNECTDDRCDFTVNVTITDPPVITCPSAPIDVSVCLGTEACVPLEIVGATNVTVEGATWANGQLCFTAEATGPMMFHVVATNDCGEATCDVEVIVSAGAGPTIDCPQAIIDVSVCAGDQACISLPIDNATNVSVEGATWADNQLCFTPNATGTFQFDITATNDCGEETCHVTVRVVVIDRPVIDCPTAAWDVTACAGDEVCIPLEITGGAEVSVEGGTWSNGQLCYIAEVAGPDQIHIIASNVCGEVFCDVTVNVTIVDPPTITCPDGPIDVSACLGTEVCVPLEIVGATNVTVEGATWANGQLCFMADATGPMAFHVVATNDCGEATCDVTVNVAAGGAPTIACPDVPVDAYGCAGDQVCISLAIDNATNVVVDGGATWADGQLCFTANATGTLQFDVTATNDCGEATCHVMVNLEVTPLPVIDCPSGPFDHVVCAGDQICVPLEIGGATSVTVEGATWADGQLCFTAEATGSHVFHVVATSDCGETTCDVTVTVRVTDPPMIECPEPMDIVLCGPEQVCFDLAIANATTVEVDGGTWNNGVLCFDAEVDGSYTLVVTAGNECGTVTCAVVVEIIFLEAPIACFDSNPTGVPMQIAFSNCSVGAEPLMFHWDFGDGGASEEAEPMHNYAEPGEYVVTLSVTDDCGRTSTVTHTVSVGGVTPTDRWISIYCPEPMLDGFPLNPGDVIRAYDPDGVLCGIGSVAGDGSYGLLVIYADDIFTAEVDEGADPGDEISLTVNGDEVFVDPPLIWNENGDVVLLCEFSTETCLQFDLDAGWHLISWNVAYSDDVANLIAGFESSVDVILSFDRGGLTYVPSLAPYSNLQQVDYHFGYWFRLNSPVFFEICGGQIPAGDAISIYGGWNLVSYWPEEILPVEDALSSILANLIVAYGWDGEAQVYIPGKLYVSNLIEMAPQFGYWIKSTTADMLTYNGSDPIAVGGNDHNATGQSNVGLSNEWMSVYGSSLQVDNRQLAAGATIELVTTDGAACGVGVYDGSKLMLTPVYGSVSIDEATENLPEKGDKLSVLVNGDRVYPDLEYQGHGAIVQLGRLTGNADGSPEALPDDYSLSQNYPNPFNPSTTIRFNLPVSEHVELVVYNLVGQRVATLVDGALIDGWHEVEWNGADDSGTRVASGVYLYRLNSANFSQTKKMTLMK
ncbi:MAG: PKD domain-containing protein [candidate division Zixibacteria bacterium]|nr:PKD domain-containing protein [candidate division Zixibacteria bacterium]MDH3938136.1 PKD domain-containing protein [candidate division Zixibacteria bacterium]MDH4033555.1 PKD domain-containing protein [candidate division Zixibacteria bacterium]